MSGLTILFILGVWGYASHFLAKFIVKPIKNSSTKSTASIVVTILLFLAPVADDIIGGFQFRSLCKKESLFVIEKEKLFGRSIYLENISDKKLSGYIVPIWAQIWSYKDVNTNELVISWIDYRAKGGWLSHTIKFPEGNPAYTFNGVCRVKDGHEFDFEKFNIKKEQRK